jgi:hypothetical protein
MRKPIIKTVRLDAQTLARYSQALTLARAACAAGEITPAQIPTRTRAHMDEMDRATIPTRN